jgi:hypothetical protein
MDVQGTGTPVLDLLETIPTASPDSTSLDAQSLMLVQIAALGIAVIILANTLVSHWFTRRGRNWSTVFSEFYAISSVNAGLTVFAFYMLPLTDTSIDLGSTLFFLLMLTMIIVVYDRYDPRYLAQLEGAAPA